MPEILYVFPAYVNQIATIVSRRDWIIHAFPTNDPLEIYNPANYLQQKEIEGIQYTAILDLNIFQFLVNSTKKLHPHQSYREAAAFLVFCQIAQIEIDPTHAVYERINYSEDNLGETLSDLEMFDKLNNTMTEMVVKYALGYSSTIPIEDQTIIDRSNLGSKLLQYHRLTEWDSLYLIILLIIDIYYDESIKKEKKLVRFVDLLIKDFRLSYPCIIYAVRLFGKFPLKRMMKFKISQSIQQKRAALDNMTWDLYFMNHFFRLWQKKKDKEETFFVSDDKAVGSLMNLMVLVQTKEWLEPIRPYLNTKALDTIKDLLANCKDRTDRIYQSESWGQTYRADLIATLQNKLFI